MCETTLAACVASFIVIIIALLAATNTENVVNTRVTKTRTLWRRNEFKSVGHMSGRKRQKFFSCLSTLLSPQVQLVVFVSALVMGSTVWSVSRLLFFCSRCPHAQPFVKVGARAPVPYGVGATAYT